VTERLAHLQGLEPYLRSRIRGQDHVIAPVASAFVRGGLNLTNPQFPRCSLLLVGPTGTGKSELFKIATEYLLGSDRLVTFDLSEYHDKSAVNKLLGVDRTDRGLLGQRLRDVPPSGVLFDEVEKAHPDVADLFLQILWEGRVTLATGEIVRFDSHYLGFTTNVGGAEAMRMDSSRFASVEQVTLRLLGRHFRPEFLARCDEKCVFQRLTPDVQREICELEVARETARLRGQGYDVAVSMEAMEILLRDGFHPQLGARPLRKTIERSLQNAVIASIFASGTACGGIVLGQKGGLMLLKT